MLLRAAFLAAAAFAASAAHAQPSPSHYTCKLDSGTGPFAELTMTRSPSGLQVAGRWGKSALGEGEMKFLATPQGGQAAGGGVYFSGNDQSSRTAQGRFEFALGNRLGRAFVAVGFVSAKGQATGLYRCRVVPVGRPLTHR